MNCPFESIENPLSLLVTCIVFDKTGPREDVCCGCMVYKKLSKITSDYTNERQKLCEKLNEAHIKEAELKKDIEFYKEIIKKIL